MSQLCASTLFLSKIWSSYRKIRLAVRVIDPVYANTLTGTSDVIGIIKDFSDVSEIMTRQNRPVCPTLGWNEIYY